MLWAAYPAVVKFYMFAGYSCYYKKGVGRGNSLGVHSFDGNETQLSPHKPATRTLPQVAGFAPLRVQGCKNFFASVPVYIEVVLEDVLLANVSLISNLPSTFTPTCCEGLAKLWSAIVFSTIL